MSDMFPNEENNPESVGNVSSSRPIINIPRKKAPSSGNKISSGETSRVVDGPESPSYSHSKKSEPVDAKEKFASAASAASGAANRSSVKPKGGGAGKQNSVKKVTNLAKNVTAGITGAGGTGSSGVAGSVSDLASKALSKTSLDKLAGKKSDKEKSPAKNTVKKKGDVDESTAKLKKDGRNATKNVNKKKGLNAGDGEEFEKSNILKRTGNSVKNLGKERCKVCGYQNGINKAGLCKTCVKKRRSSPDQVSKIEKAKNKSIDLQAKVGAKALGKAAQVASAGLVPSSLVEKASEGVLGKSIAAQQKVAKTTLVVIAGGLGFFILIIGMVVLSIFGGGGGGNIQESAEVGSSAENTSEVPAGQLEVYYGAARTHQVPWSLLAAAGEVTTKHGSISPYDDEERASIYPFVEPAIVGDTGRGPLLLTDFSITDGVIRGASPGGGRVLDPRSANLTFEKQPGKLNPNGELLPAVVAARDFIEQAWPDSPIVSDWRERDGFDHHFKGEALDIGCKGACTAADVQRLNVIAAWFAQNPLVFGTSFIIWDQRINSGNGWTLMEDRGNATQNHFDHIHLNFENPGRASLGPLGDPWKGSSLADVSANNKNSPYRNVPDESGTAAPTLNENETAEEGQGDDGEEPVEFSDEFRQDYAQEVDILAGLMAEARDVVYMENEDFYKEYGLDTISLSQNPFKDEIHLEFWERVLERLPIDFENIAFQGGVSSGAGGSNVILGDDVEAVISQLVWAKRWIESSNTYDLVNSYGYKGAYQYGDREWGNFKGYPQAHLAPPDVQDEKMANDYRQRLIAYDNDVKKAVQHHLCPASVGEDDVICELKHNLSRVQVNPDMGTYWACSAVLLNALPGNEGKYSYAFTSAPPPGVETYEKNCKGRIPTALKDERLPSSVRESSSNDTNDVELASVSPAAAETVAADEAAQDSETQPGEGEGGEEENAEEESGIDLDTVPVSSQPKERVFALATLQEAAKLSGLELELLEGRVSGDDSDEPGVIIDGSPSAEGFIWPTTGPVTSGFGPRWGTMHRGIDMAPPRNTPVVASKEGVVAFTFGNCGEGSITNFCGTPPFGGYGNVVLVQHEGGIYTLYAHLEAGSIRVKEGQTVQRGQQLAGVGSSGNSTGPHLHFEVRTARTHGAQDPMIFMPR